MSFRHFIPFLLFSGCPLFGADCAIEGIVVNSISGEAIPRARVSINGVNGPNTTADNSGKWNFAGVPCGPARVVAQRPGFTVPAVRPVALVAGQPRTDFKLELTPQVVITGRIIDDLGDPVMGAQVSIFFGRIADGKFTFHLTTGAQSNDLGEFRIPNLERGKYIVCAGSRCYPGLPDGGRASAMDLAPGRDARVEIIAISDAHTVHVRGAVSGLPAGRGLSVSLVPSANRGIGMKAFDAPVGPKGTFDIAGVSAGSYQLAADYFESGTRMSLRVPVEVGNSDSDGLTVSLEAAVIRGIVRVEATSGAVPPVPQFAVYLRPPIELRTSTSISKWTTDHQSFVLADLVPGTYRLDATPPLPFYIRSASLGGVDLLAQADVSISRAAGTLEIVLANDGGSLSGDVAGADGQPAPSGILLLPVHGRPRIVNTQPDGHFIVPNLPPGDYSVSAWDHVQDVEYSNSDWMRRYATGTPVTIAASQPSQLSLKQLAAPPL